jgi:hypothetical protein
MNPKKK